MFTSSLQLNIVFVVLSAITLIVYLSGPSFLYQDFDDDGIIKIVEDSYIYQSIFSGISIGVSAIVIFGANRYNMILVVSRRDTSMSSRTSDPLLLTDSNCYFNNVI
jgi:hypothetical protein